jgi:hypothetical protein
MKTQVLYWQTPDELPPVGTEVLINVGTFKAPILFHAIVRTGQRFFIFGRKGRCTLSKNDALEYALLTPLPHHPHSGQGDSQEQAP